MTNPLSGPLSGRRVLIVEDEIMVAWGLQDMLMQLGCAVVGPASRVDQALGMIEAETFDAVVLDVNLNGEKSYPVADALAKRGVPFVFATAYGVTVCRMHIKVCPCFRSLSSAPNSARRWGN